MAFSWLAIVAGAVLLLLATPSHLVALQEVEDETEFSYLVGSDNGPERWSLLHKEWGACNNGDLQSPIDLSDRKVEVVHHLGRLRRTYRPSPAVLRNRGHDIMLKYPNGSGGILMNGTEYKLKQLHWHSPSEHTLNGKRFALELHMVHESAYGEIAVVGILYKNGRPDPFLAQMEKHIYELKDVEDEEQPVGVVDPRQARWGSRKYYRYTGSLTTPPCTEGVLWTLISKVRTVSKRQTKLLREAVNDHMENNARPAQPTNDRTVHYFRPRRTGF